MHELERYRQLIGFSADGVYELDLHGCIARINGSGCAALCVADQVSVIGRPLAAFWPPASRATLEAAMVAARTGQPVQFTQMLPQLDGAEGWWLVSVHPYLDPLQQVDALAVISHDITERVRARQALDMVNLDLHSRLNLSELAGASGVVRNEALTRRLARARLFQKEGLGREELLRSQLGLASAAQLVAEHASRQAQKNEAIGQLVAGLSHDFSNMLQIAIVAISSIEDDSANLTDGQRKLLGYSMDGVQHASLLAKRLLAFARVHRYLDEPIELATIVCDIESFARHSLGAGMNFQVEPATAELSTQGDRHSVEQAFINLCINARDACNGQGAIRVRLGEMTVDDVHAGTLRPAGDYVTLAVSDNGCGMGAEVREHLFEPYFTTKPEGVGTGLGLAQVYGVVRQAGGFVDVESAPGQGTTFTMAFPRLQLPDAD